MRQGKRDGLVLLEPAPAPRFLVDGVGKVIAKGGMVQFVLYVQGLGEEVAGSKNIELVVAMPLEAVALGYRMARAECRRAFGTSFRTANLHLVT